MALHLNKHECPSPKNALWQVWYEIDPVDLEKKIFKFRQCILQFLNYLPLRKGQGPSFKQTWKLELRRFLNCVMYFCYFLIISPWKKMGPFIWRNLIPFHPGVTLCQVWLKLAQRFGRRRFLKVINITSLFCNYLPFGNGSGPSFVQTWILFIQGCFVPGLVIIDPVVLEKKLKIRKVYRRMDRQTDNRRSENSAQVT